MATMKVRLIKVICEQLGVTADKVTDSARFTDDLAADSLDMAEVVMAIEDEFGIKVEDDAAESISTVQEALDYLEQRGIS